MSVNRTNKIGTKHQWEAFRPKACKVQYGNSTKAYFDSRQNMSSFCNLLCTVPLFTTNLEYKLEELNSQANIKSYNVYH